MADPPLSSHTDTGANLGDEWPAKIADTAVRLVEQVRDKTTRPAIIAARALVFGLVALVIGTVAGFLFLIGTIRLVNGYLPGKVWTTYLLLGGIFTVGGALLFSLRKPRTGPVHPNS
jgi:vacuolar-type H+-ATPase subunit I/STV1